VFSRNHAHHFVLGRATLVLAPQKLELPGQLTSIDGIWLDFHIKHDTSGDDREQRQNQHHGVDIGSRFLGACEIEWFVQKNIPRMKDCV
jgi:hypothetical protein